MNSTEKDYIFGYASLIERESRTRTVSNAIAAEPVIVHGVERGWWVHGSSIGYSTCFLGARISSNSGAQCNGVIYPVSKTELEKLDLRESYYERIEIKPEDITFLDGRETFDEETAIWVYAIPVKVAGDEPKPNPRFPIVQSYVDICLNGCIEIEAMYPLAKKARFTEMFIKTTLDWNHYWVNDRLYPRRPFIFVPRAHQIDHLLKSHLPDLFDKIQLQPARWED